MKKTALLAGLLTGLGALSAVAGEQAPLRVVARASEQDGFSRLVLDLPAGLAANPVIDDDHVTLLFSRPMELKPPPRTPSNVRALVAVGSNGLMVELAPGATARVRLVPNRLVIDALAPAPASRRHRPAQAEVEPLLPTLAREPSPPPQVPQGSPSPSWPGLARPPTSLPRAGKEDVDGRAAPGHDAKAAATPATPPITVLPPSAPPPARENPSVLFPFPAPVGAAAFLRAGKLVVVFDRPGQVTLPLAGGSVEVLPTATVLRLPLRDQATPILTREQAGWRLAWEPAGKPLPPLGVERQPGTLRLRAGQAGRVVTIPDPASGGVLLVGTETGAADRIERRWETPEFGVLPTLLGVAIEPYSDRVQLYPERGGFRVGTELGALALSTGPLRGAVARDAAGLTQSMTLSNLPLAALRAELLDRRAAAAATPPLARGQPRLALARAMLALGMAQDALGVLGAAAAGDPRLAADPDYALLRGAAAVLAFRPDKADGLSEPRLPATDDVTLWRALRDAESGKPSKTMIAALARTAPLLLDAPEPVHRALLPLAAETLVAGGETDAAKALLSALPEAPELALARAMSAEAAGNAGDALSRYDALANGADRLQRIKAALRAVDLRVARGMLSPAAAAEALDRLEAAWRGDGIELARRERAAALRAQARQWRTALAGLREAAARFPAESTRLGARRQSVLADALRQDAARSMKPADFVAMLGENEDVFAPVIAAPDLRDRLAGQLLALDLPPEAAPLLNRLLADMPAGASRAALGARLAEVLLAAGDGAGAKAALSGSAAGNLPPALAAHRAVLEAKLTAAGGDVQGALRTLAAVGTNEADALRADLAEQAGDLRAAAEALRGLMARTLPATGNLDEAGQQLVLRLASDSARAGDSAALDQLRTDLGNRLTPGPTADMIRLLLAEPVRKLADLPRAAKEASLASAVAERLAGEAKRGRVVAR